MVSLRIQVSFLLLLCLLQLRISAQFFATQADHERKVDSFSNVLKAAKEDTSKVNTLNAFSQWLAEWSEEERPKAMKYLENSLSLSQKLNYQTGKATASLIIAYILREQGKYGESLKHNLEALKIRELANDHKGIAQCYWGLGATHFGKKEFSKAFENYDVALKKAIQSGDKPTIIGAYETLGMYFMHREPPSYPESLRYYLMILKIAEEMDNKEALFVAYNQIGLLYSRLGNYSEALKYFLEMKAKTGQGAPTGNLLSCYRQLKYYVEAINLLNRNIDEYKTQNDNRRLAIRLGQLGIVYKELAEDLTRSNENIDTIGIYLNNALKAFDAAKKIERDQNLNGAYTGINLDYGVIYKMKAEILQKKETSNLSVASNLNLALDYFLRQLLDTGYRFYNDVKADCYVKAGEVKYLLAALIPEKEAIKKYDEALRYLDTGLKVAKVVPDKAAIKDVYWVRSEIYKKINRYDKSFEALKLYDEIKDSIKADEANQKVEQMKNVSETLLGVTEEKARYESVIDDMQFKFLKKEDSLNFQQRLAEEKFKQQQKEVQLKQADLALANKQNELNQLAYLKSQAELQSEQSKGQEKEKQLKIAGQEKALQASQLKLKESQIRSEKRQQFFYMGGIVLLLLLFFFAYRNFKNRQQADRLIAAEKLKAEKAAAAQKMTELELQSLRAQLNPHFMFNSLNAIQELILKEDNDNSHLYLSRFAELLRMLLDNANQPFVSLRKEIDLLELYLSLEKLRIPDLQYSVEIDETIDTNRIIIPNMILQPYLENAIWHGLSHKKGSRNLTIKVKRKEHSVVCEVEDNGVGRKVAAELKSHYRKEHRSKGMELLSKRFILLSKEYGSEIQTTVEDLHDNGTALGTKVSITVPYSLTQQARSDDKSNHN